MTRDSPLGLLVLHAVRITGFADTPVVAHRYGLDAAETKEATATQIIAQSASDRSNVTISDVPSSKRGSRPRCRSGRS